LAANGMTLRPTKCHVCYQKFPNSDAYVDKGVLILRSGRDVKRIHKATLRGCITSLIQPTQKVTLLISPLCILRKWGQA
jgi:hypothetical protein